MSLQALRAELDRRCGPEWESNGPMPLLTLEEFFDSHDSLRVHDQTRRGLLALRERPEVHDVRLGLTRWEADPEPEYFYVITTLTVAAVRNELRACLIDATEMGVRNEHRATESIALPKGYRKVWAWID